MEKLRLLVGFKIWFEVETKDGDTVPLLGEQKIRLLKAIKETGSINKAAQSLGIDFKKAWQMIDSINEKLRPEKIIISSKGGKGGSRLTELGEEILAQYKELQEIFQRTLEESQHKKITLETKKIVVEDTC